MSANLVKDLRSKWDIHDWARGKMRLAADRIEELEFRETAHVLLLKTLDEQEKRIAELEAALMDDNGTKP